MKVKVRHGYLKPGQVFDALHKTGGDAYRGVVFREIVEGEVVTTTSRLKPDLFEFFTEMTHADLVEDLVKPGTDILRSMTPVKMDMLHMASCLCGEAAELLDADPEDKENIIEELGDLEFYLQGLCQAADIPHGDWQGVRLHAFAYHALCGTVVVAAGRLFDTVKRHIFYEKPFDHSAVEGAVAQMIENLALIRNFIGVTRHQVQEANMTKLLKRYPDGYTNSAALARADKQ